MYSTVSDNANISIHPFGDEIYSLAETPFAHRIDLDSLDTLTTVITNPTVQNPRESHTNLTL